MQKKKRVKKRLIGERLVLKMAVYEGKVVPADFTSGNMLFKPILEEGVFLFDCSSDDRDAAFPSLSFTNQKNRDTPIMNHKVPMYTPTFECVSGQQIVTIEVSYLALFSSISAINIFYIFCKPTYFTICFSNVSLYLN